MRISCMILALTMMSGCSVLSKQPIEQKIEVTPPQIVEVAVDDDICLFTSEPENFDYNCDMAYWLEVWLEADATPWIERKAQLTALGQSKKRQNSRLPFILIQRYPVSRQATSPTFYR